MSFLAALNYGRSVVDAVAGVTFRIEGQSSEFIGNWSSHARTRLLAQGGFEEAVSGVIVCSKAQFDDMPSVPTDGKRLHHDNRTYRIIGVDTDASSYTLTLGSVNR